MREYRLYIFDFDMTLFDSMKGVRKCYRKAFDAVNIPFNETLCPMYVRESIDQTFHRYSQSPCKFREFVSAFINESRVSMIDNTTIFPETEAVILELKKRGKILCIASGKMEERIIQILEKHQLCGCFDHIFGYERMLEPKPSPFCLNWIMSQYDIPKEDVCYIGDSQKDMISAESAGVDGIYIPRGNPDHAPCVAKISDLRELLDY